MSSIVSKNIFWLTASRMFALMMLFFAYARLFRYLGPEVYGQYQFTLSYVMLFSTVVDFGIQQFITKKISESPNDAKKYFQSFLIFESVVAILLYGVLIAIAYQSHYGKVVFTAISITGMGMVANALTYPFLSVMTAAQDLRKVALINFLNSLVNITIIFLAVWLHRSIIFLAAIQLTFGILDLVLYQIFIRKHLPKPDILRALSQFDFSIIKNILVSAWPFVLLVGFSAIYNRIDIVIIGQLQGYVQTGYYGAAYKIYDLLAFFPSVVSHTLFPFFTGLMVKNALSEVRINLEKYIRLMVMLALPMAVGGMILSKQLIELVAGPQFLPAAPVLSIIIWAPAILFIYIPVNSLVISQLTKKALLITGANVLLNIGGNLLLIPHYGIRAAAVMTVVSESLQGIFYFYFVRSTITHFRIYPLFWKQTLGAIVMGIVLWKFSSLPLAASVILGATVYLAVLIATKFFTMSDITAVKKLVFK